MMNSKDVRKKQNPEAKLQKAIVEYLRSLEWFVKETHGNVYQSGFPDLWCSHHNYGHRWVEVKLPGMVGSKFTGAQLRDFPLFCAHGSGVWIMTAATLEEYEKLKGESNWHLYLLLNRGMTL